jgi:hypothetical protein
MTSMMRISITLVVCLACGSAAAAPIKVFILAGQSNAGGGMPFSTAPAPLNAAQQSLFQYRAQTSQLVESANWEAMRPLIGPTGWGTELSFAMAMEQRTGSPIALIKTTWNATTLWRDWLPTTTSTPALYPWMMEKVNSSLDQLAALGYQPDISGFLWIQGEGDANQEDKALAYDENLAVLASHLRADLATADMPFLFNQAHIDLNRPFVDELRASQAQAVALDPNMHMVNFDDLPLGPDNVHWTPETHVELGRRFADVLMPSGDFNDDGLVDAADLPSWRSAIGSDRSGDGNADGVSDGHDFLLWQRQVAAPASAPGAAAIPEPSSAWLLTLYALLAGPMARSTLRGRRQASENSAASPSTKALGSGTGV